MLLQLTSAPGFGPQLLTALGTVRWLGVGLAFGAYFVLGALWYMGLFAQAYKVALGKAGQELDNQSPLYIAGPAACVLVITVVSAVLLRALHVDTYGGGLLFAALIGFGYLVANTVNIGINPNIPRPFLYGAITGAYHLVGITLASLIMVAMR
ncbi:DUF1761 domain-containing protein [Hymenobacter sp. ASUV-10]|uniref:DUF1761 domain-containing protein n=1 Tax=Hymenobacter aranciens TaxID=3063996 RepID=A0ABT9BBM4_9BACT|nr:DUF1761 domain-containing protein [Hymenobacter sp. ASUV-10]MDO7875670.1 DUF1761 domain-containing protein [Hymenobacter sp. ASUV-10]